MVRARGLIEAKEALVGAITVLITATEIEIAEEAVRARQMAPSGIGVRAKAPATAPATAQGRPAARLAIDITTRLAIDMVTRAARVGSLVLTSRLGRRSQRPVLCRGLPPEILHGKRQTVGEDTRLRGVRRHHGEATGLATTDLQETGVIGVIAAAAASPGAATDKTKAAAMAAKATGAMMALTMLLLEEARESLGHPRRPQRHLVEGSLPDVPAMTETRLRR